MTPDRPDAYPAELPRLDNMGWKARYDPNYIGCFGDRRLALVRGEGTRVWDAEGNEYLDFLTGISVCNLGHCHPRIVAAIQRQAATLDHCTNLYYVPAQIELAELLLRHTFEGRLFFANSGAEANEAAIKIARRFTKMRRGTGHHEILTFEGSFHGRTMATLTATGQDKVKTDFEPLLPGFVHAPFNDLAAAERLTGDQTCAIMVEPIVGEGGIRPADEAFLRGLRELCDARGILLIFDEVQCGLGRAGRLWAYQHYGVEPDILTLGKSIGGGLPMGVMICRPEVAEGFPRGAHGTTMGGNPIVSAAGHAYLKELIEGDWPRKAGEAGCYLWEQLVAAVGGSGLFKEIRGRGLMLAVELTEGAADVLLGCERGGLLLNVTGGETLRFLPPLNVTREEIERAVEIFAEAIAERADAAGRAT